MSEFEKIFEEGIYHPKTAADTPIEYYEDVKYLKGISRHFYIAALKWAKKIIYNDAGTDDIIGYVSPIKIIEQEIAEVEREQK